MSRMGTEDNMKLRGLVLSKVRIVFILSEKKYLGILGSALGK